MNSVELFAGAGGLALGVARAGFTHKAVVEIDRRACDTIRENIRRQVAYVKDWPLFEADIRQFNYAEVKGDVDLLSAGVPCQPFSFGGSHRGHFDERNLFPETAEAIARLRPKAVLIENVKGLLRSTFRPYFEYVLAMLTLPEVRRGEDEPWTEHFERLQRDRGRSDVGTRYVVHYHQVNAADFGIPQWRDRVIIVAFRADLGVNWSPPPATHSLDALLWSQWWTKEYWDRHGLPQRVRPGAMSLRYQQAFTRLKSCASLATRLTPWATVRDALHGLPKLRQGQTSADVENHFLNPGARAYERHVGSSPDEPAKTLKAGSHGVPGGENTLALGGGRVRYFSVRECARLQTFPDNYVFPGAWTRAMRQLGNAVPVALAETFALRIAESLREAQSPGSAAKAPTHGHGARVPDCQAVEG
ncbi:DNA cytosine methyltransferase M.NgoMIII [Myxococcus hansupus]|uniref:DNA (cytosine-5-)-methyltransferase n=1 Tax=Pseudomyxococcus hansupus TaxID=1297742 RepID=A0A0H4X392_9BACT|nr:DNA cytosine methyltransferase [Myxococcus hansupus]AKQ68363.1 DNA cytosine methyltransferase M.NgoMIII [Myxococcus hansupus]